MPATIFQLDVFILVSPQPFRIGNHFREFLSGPVTSQTRTLLHNGAKQVFANLICDRPGLGTIAQGPLCYDMLSPHIALCMKFSKTLIDQVKFVIYTKD